MDMMKLNMSTFKEYLQKIDTVLIPIGMIEAHGPHSSLGTDILIPREFVRRLEPLIGEKVMMAPEIPYGHSWHLSSFPGTIDVSQQAFSHYVLEIGKNFFSQGLKHIILFNGHGGNISSLSYVSEQLAELGAYVLTINWWLDYKKEIEKIAEGIGHAGEDETSAILAINEELVEMKNLDPHTIRTPLNLKYKGMEKEVYPNAFSGNPTLATKEKGEKIYHTLLPLIVKDIEKMWELSKKTD